MLCYHCSVTKCCVTVVCDSVVFFLCVTNVVLLLLCDECCVIVAGYKCCVTSFVWWMLCDCCVWQMLCYYCVWQCCVILYVWQMLCFTIVCDNVVWLLCVTNVVFTIVCDNVVWLLCVTNVVFTIVCDNVVWLLCVTNVVFTIVCDNVVWFLCVTNVVFTIVYDNVVWFLCVTNIVLLLLLTKQEFLNLSWSIILIWVLCSSGVIVSVVHNLGRLMEMRFKLRLGLGLSRENTGSCYQDCRSVLLDSWFAMHHISICPKSDREIFNLLRLGLALAYRVWDPQTRGHGQGGAVRRGSLLSVVKASNPSFSWGLHPGLVEQEVQILLELPVVWMEVHLPLLSVCLELELEVVPTWRIDQTEGARTWESEVLEHFLVVSPADPVVSNVLRSICPALGVGVDWAPELGSCCERLFPKPGSRLQLIGLDQSGRTAEWPVAVLLDWLGDWLLWSPLRLSLSWPLCSDRGWSSHPWRWSLTLSWRWTSLSWFLWPHCLSPQRETSTPSRSSSSCLGCSHCPRRGSCS